ncbi:MAG: Ig-like domain-containing protein [Lysobacterales bacterium]
MKSCLALVFALVVCLGVTSASAEVSASPEAKLPLNPATGKPYEFSRNQAQVQKLELEELICHTALGLPHNGAFGAALVALTPLEGNAFGFTAWSLNLALKACPPALDAPDDVEITPQQGVCEGKISRPDTNGNATNILGVQGAVSGSWGAGGSPKVFSWNTDVQVDSTFGLPGGLPAEDSAGLRTLPLGIYSELFIAENMASGWDFVFIPAFKLPKGIERFLGGEAGRKAAEVVLSIAIEVGLIAADQNNFIFPGFRTGTFRGKPREIAVLDVFPPVASVSQSEYDIEALELGGASVRGPSPSGATNRDVLRAGFTVTDDCDPDVELGEPVPAFWPIGERTRVVWTARDDGPNRDREENTTQIEQFVTVVDTLPPVIQTAPDEVVETDGPTAVVALQQPRVFDFGDANPVITLEGEVPPETLTLPRGQNPLLWTATDAFGQSASATQLINVKGVGENRPPSAVPTSANAITFSPVEIVLNGSDPDADPLSFRIEQFPPGGGFEAPLLPFFVEDFRGTFEAASACDPGRGFDVLADPSQVKITDSGLTYVLDCNEPGVQGNSRVSVLTADRELIAGRALPRNSSLVNGIYIAPGSNEILYSGGAFGSTFFRLDALTLDTIVEYRPRPSSQIGGINAFMIDANDLLYVPDGLGNIDVFDLTQATDEGDFFLMPERLLEFDLDPLETSGGGYQAVRDIAITNSGDLLFVSESRIHRMTGSRRDANGNPVIGQVVGWLGACGSGEGCDLSRLASRGYSCITGVTCNTGAQEFFGSNPGQLRLTQSLAIDRRDNVYVAEFGNSRVSRFTDDGVFGGQAQSVCPADQRCFVLGDFGRPSVISVNSRNLYVLDTATDVVHVFETSVIEPIDDTSARVTYTANDGFQGVDTFTFSAGDGLDSSAPTPATINVSRNFRPPVADELRATGMEDTPLSIRLSATDPDGALDLPLAYEVLTMPDQGTLSGTPPVLIYSPPLNWHGTTSFTFRASDDRSSSQAGTVAIEITPVNDPPTIEFVALDTDDPATAEVEVTAGYPANFTFRFNDVDDVDLHRFDVTWSPGDAVETDVLSPSAGNASPLLVAMSKGGDVAASHTFSSAGQVSRVRACIVDNVVLDQNQKLDSTTSLTDCLDLNVVNRPRPELDVEILAPTLIPAQERFAQIEVRVTNRAPQSGAGVAAGDLTVTIEMPDTPVVNKGITGCSFAGLTTTCNVASLASGDTFVETFTVDTQGLSEGAELIASVDAAVASEVTSPSRTQAGMTIGPLTDIVVTASEGAASGCRLECSRSGVGCSGATVQPVCTLTDALALAENGTLSSGPPVIALGEGTFTLDAASAPYRVDTSLSIVGIGTDRTRLSGQGQFRLLVSQGNAVTVSDLQLTSADAGIGGAAVQVADGSQLTLENVAVNNSTGTSVIRNAGGDLMLSGVSFADNTVEENLIDVQGVTTLNNVMMIDNQHIQGQFFGLIRYLSGSVRLNHVTAVGNDSPVLFSLPGAGFIEITNSIFADSSQPACRTDAITAQTSSGGNLFRPSSGCPMAALDIETVEPLLADRVTRSGHSIRAPLEDSPAVDRIRGACLDEDLLGTGRPVDGNNDGRAACDSGAIELRPESVFANGFES